MQRFIKFCMVILLQLAGATPLWAEQWITYSEPTYIGNESEESLLVFRDKPAGYNVRVRLYKHVGIGFQHSESNVVVKNSSVATRSKLTIEQLQFTGILSDHNLTNWTFHISPGLGEATLDCQDPKCQSWGKQIFAFSYHFGIGYQISFLELFAYTQVHFIDLNIGEALSNNVNPAERGTGIRLIF